MFFVEVATYFLPTVCFVCFCFPLWFCRFAKNKSMLYVEFLCRAMFSYMFSFSHRSSIVMTSDWALHDIGNVGNKWKSEKQVFKRTCRKRSTILGFYLQFFMHLFTLLFHFLNTCFVLLDVPHIPNISLQCDFITLQGFLFSLHLRLLGGHLSDTN